MWIVLIKSRDPLVVAIVFVLSEWRDGGGLGLTASGVKIHFFEIPAFGEKSFEKDATSRELLNDLGPASIHGQHQKILPNC